MVKKHHQTLHYIKRILKDLLFFQYAYLLKQQGVHVTTAQRLLGHSDPRVTMGIYTQVLDNEIDDVGLLLSKAAGF